MSLYTAIIIITWASLFVLSFLVYENARLQKKEKILLYITYAIVALAALNEWLGVKIAGNADIPTWVLRFVKFWDYVLTPITGGIIIFQLPGKTIWKKILIGILVVNTLFQLISAFTGWMTVIDTVNNYTHGPLYFVYIVFYALILLIVVIEFARYGRKFTKRNLFSLYLIVALVVLGILLQEIFGHGIRTAYITLAVGVSLLFIHYVEFSQIASDKQIQEQMVKISIDPLTNLQSRHAYMEAIEALDKEASLPDDLVVFSIDINGLKETNDTRGHLFGDELIKGAADTITSVFSKYGQCYRVGGDEFMVIAYLDKDLVSKLKNDFKHKIGKWHGTDNLSLSASIGGACACLNQGLSIEKLIYISDQEMYKAKNDYYRNNGIDRRHNYN